MVSRELQNLYTTHASAKKKKSFGINKYQVLNFDVDPKKRAQSWVRPATLQLI